VSPTAEVLAPLAQADLLLLFAEILRSPPSGDGPPASAGAADIAFPVATGAAGIEALVAASGLEGVDAQAIAALLDSIESAGTTFSPGERARLFEARGCCLPNETAWVRRDKGAILADLLGFYTAFGFRPSAGTGEKADHLLCELEFAAMLLVALSRAAAAGDAEREAIVRRGLAAFTEDHVDEWLPAFCARLAEAAADPAARDAALLLRRSWDALLDRYGLARAERAAARAARSANDDVGPYECDGCPGGA
jgi:nitrate reductase assembly molybdenum cofactor insertion protein NarJ